MFKASCPNASTLKQVIQALSKISDELVLYATQEGISIKALSPDKTTLAVVEIPSIALEEYTVEEEATLAIPTVDFKKITRRATRNDVLVLTINRETNELVVTLRDKKTSIERKFTIPLVPKEPESIPEIKMELPVSFTMLSQDFKNIVGDLRLVGEEVVIMYDENKVIIKSTGHQKEYVCELFEGNPLVLLTSLVNKAKATYDIDILAVAVQSASAAKNVTISFDTDKPMKIEYELGDGGKLVYWLVPRI